MSKYDPELLSTQSRFVRAGPELDRLVAEKVFGCAEILPYSTSDDHCALVCGELVRRGYELDFESADVVTAWLIHDGKADFHAWGFSVEEAICRSALRLFGSNPG